MYSKCIVSPFIKTPIAITASKADVEPLLELVDAWLAVAVRSVADMLASKSVAETVPVVEDWIVDAEYTLCTA